MSRVRGAPPGRAGRLWLLRRLRVAERGAELLERKLRILRGEERRYRLLAERAETAWVEQCRQAETWLVRGALLGGQRALRLATAEETADAHVTWASAMGVRYPAEGVYAYGDAPPTSATPSNAALIAARDAFRDALRAAVECAVADAALRTVTAEIALTGRRRRAIEDRWIPMLTDALRAADFALEELEHADAVRLQWVIRHRRATDKEP